MKTKKSGFVGVRLTPHQEFELSNIARELNLSKSQVIRCSIDNLIESYYSPIV